MKTKLFLFVAILILCLGSQGLAQIPIFKSCTIDKSGDYYLANDIYGEILITADSVSFCNHPGNHYKIFGNGNQVGVKVRANDVSVSGIDFENLGTGVSIGAYRSSITECSVDSCTFIHCYFGVYTSYSNHNRVINNLFSNCGFQSIYLSCSNENKIINNEVNSTGCDGIGLVYSDNNEISNNTTIGGDSNGVFGVDVDSTCKRNYSIVDNSVIGKQGNRVAPDNNIGLTSDVENPEKIVVAGFSLSQNYPNPFNPETRISYSIEKAGQVKLAVYNVLGQKVADLVNEFKAANTYKVNFDASKLTSGVYFYRLEVGDYSKTMKMIFCK
ncbi:MAG: T9SS type A sorting domain-containing protein [Patescibacteria group bacterium]